jgi:hypothetical protein
MFIGAVIGSLLFSNASVPEDTLVEEPVEGKKLDKLPEISSIDVLVLLGSEVKELELETVDDVEEEKNAELEVALVLLVELDDKEG